MLRVAILSFLCGFAFGEDFEKPIYILEHAEYYFNDFVQTYNKNYANEDERQARLKTFTENLIKINKKNEIDTAVYGVNHLSDLTAEEFAEKYTGLKPLQDMPPNACKKVVDADIPPSKVPVPESFDWRVKNVVTPVRSQGHCGSCYAFSSAGNIESQYAIHNNGIMLDVSVQQLVSCSKLNNACGGGLMTTCMTDVINMGGIELASDYPYANHEGPDVHPCQFNQTLAKVKLSGCINYNIVDEELLKQVLYENGPISVGVVVGNEVQNYIKGVITDCPGTTSEVNHAVILVGYGTDSVKGPYWTIKNSWASHWGEQGYFRIARGKNSCAIVNPFMASAIVA